MNERERLTETLRWLCEIQSFTGEEGALCDAVQQRLVELDGQAPLRRHGNSLVVEARRQSGGPHIVLAGHLDVVRSRHDGPVRVEGERLYGPGAADMKSGLALMLDLFAHDRERCHADLTLVFYAGEEGPYADNELGQVFACEPELTAADLALCLEPSDNKLSLGATGSVHATVRFTGRSAHSARPWQGDNAIHRAGTLLCRLANLPPQPAIIDGLEYQTVTSVTWASGGRSYNMVPDEFTLNLNHRFAPNISLDQAREQVTALVAGEAEISWRDLSPPALPHAEHPLVVELQQAGAMGIEPKQAWTDVARFAAHGVAAVNFGPGVNAQAHQPNEWTDLTKLEQGRKILLRWLGSL